MRDSLRTHTVFFGLVTALGCSAPSGGKAEEQQVPCAVYFDFDDVMHYSIDMGEDEVWDLESIEHKSDVQEKLSRMLTQDEPTTLSDSGMVMDPEMERIGFARRSIPSEHLNTLRAIFCEREHADPIFAACTATWRDILVFRQHGRIVGIAKICFGCGQSAIVGTERNTGNFGQSGDFAELGKVLEASRN